MNSYLKAVLIACTLLLVSCSDGSPDMEAFPVSTVGTVDGCIVKQTFIRRRSGFKDVVYIASCGQTTTTTLTDGKSTPVATVSKPPAGAPN